MSNPLADVVDELSDEQLRRIAALMRLRQPPLEVPKGGQQAA